MAGRKSPGQNPMGHSPFGHEKLEGPKKHHDDHGKHASVPSGGHIPNKHWEMGYSPSCPSRNMMLTEGADFAPKQSDMRKTTYVKVNKEDH